MSKQKKNTLHRNNTHKFGYDFKNLCKLTPDLKQFLFTNKFETETIDFANPEAVKCLNSALLKTHYNISFWNFPDANLCPPIPGRVDYIHYLSDLLSSSGINKNSTVLDIGTGASCIYPLLGHAVYNWNFIASEINKSALKFAKKNVAQNNFEAFIEVRHQTDSALIFDEILMPSEKISASMCNPPFYKSALDAISATKQKQKGLGIENDTLVRNFSGTLNELCYKGGEKAFLHNYLYQSSLIKKQCFWFTILVSNKKLLKSMYLSLEKLKASEIKTIQMSQGNKISRIVAWTFLTNEEQKQFVE